MRRINFILRYLNMLIIPHSIADTGHQAKAGPSLRRGSALRLLPGTAVTRQRQQQDLLLQDFIWRLRVVWGDTRGCHADKG